MMLKTMRNLFVREIRIRSDFVVNLVDLYTMASDDGITVDCFDMKECSCISLMQDAECFIAIDPLKLKSQQDELVKLAHELGHCETGSFYNQYSKCDIRRKHEHQADVWAIKKLIPEDELKKACKYCVNRWELSEYFGVPEDFMRKALDFYCG